MNNRIHFQSSLRGVGFCISALVVSMAQVMACPDCTLINSGGVIEPQTVMAKEAFSSGTLLLMGIFLSVIGFMIWSMVKACRELDIHKERPPSSGKGV